MSRKHWNNCITHRDGDFYKFTQSYFSRSDRHFLLIGAAGFDPRATIIAQTLVSANPAHLDALFIREEREAASANLQQAGDANASFLQQLIKNCSVNLIAVFAVDGAAVGGIRVTELLKQYQISPNVTDIVLDMTALSTGIGYPAALFLLRLCEQRNLNFHLMIASSPELDANVISEPADRPMDVRGFSGDAPGDMDESVAQIWVPQLAKGRLTTLNKIRAANTYIYKICPLLPYPAFSPRRSDDLIATFASQLRDEWQVDPRDMIYVSEHNPVDAYRTLSMLHDRYTKTVAGIFRPQIILSPVGSKVMAIGVMMAAIEHKLTVQYVETLRYEFDFSYTKNLAAYDTTHLWLHGDVYNHYNFL